MSEDVLDCLSTGVVFLDAAGAVVYLNSAAEQLLGISLRQVHGLLLHELRPNQELETLIQRTLAHRRSYSLRELPLAPVPPLEHRELTVDCRVSPIGGGDTPERLLLELLDARPRLRVDRDAAQIAQHNAGRSMVRQLAHEIKNPLGGLRGAAQLLERRLDSQDLREYTDVILREADRLVTLVDTMLGPGRPPNRTDTNVHEVLRHVGRLVEAEASSGVELLEDYDPSLPAVALDRNEMVQALLNLARNAMQALDGEGRILLRTRALTQVTINSHQYTLGVRIDVEDDGPGVPPDLRTTLFYPLVSGRRDGTGLGLPLAQELVARQGGVIEFETRRGRTVFSVLLPVERQA